MKNEPLRKAVHGVTKTNLKEMGIATAIDSAPQKLVTVWQIFSDKPASRVQAPKGTSAKFPFFPTAAWPMLGSTNEVRTSI